MFGESRVFTAKLIIPRPRRHTLVRSRLVQRLSEALEVPLTIVQAGPGYGKTTALASFLAEQPVRAVWYSIGKDDADPLPFLLHLIHGFRMQNPLIGEKAATVLEEGQGPERPWHLAVEALINDMVFSSQPETVIVLDDFHLVDQTPAIVQVIEHMVDHLPPQVHLVLLTRRRPLLPNLPKWRARADVLELGEEDLAFTRDEVLALFRGEYGVDLTAGEVGGLFDQTEGWIIALQLIWQGMRKGYSLEQVSGVHPDNLDALFVYLAQEVLERQKPFVRRFLLNTAVLDRLIPAACDAVMGESGSAGVLSALEENGLFTYTVGAGVFRYHQLFQQFLREQAQRDYETWRASHLAAARFFTSDNSPEYAAIHYLAAGEANAAGEAVLAAAPALLENGRVEALAYLLKQVPETTFGGYPELLLRRGDVARLTSQFEQAIESYRKAAEAYRATGDQRGLCLSLQSMGRVYLDTINPGSAEQLFSEALGLSDSLSDEERAYLMELIAENETNRGNPEDAARFARLAALKRPLRDDLEVRAMLRTGRLDAAMGLLELQVRQEKSKASRSHREVPLLIALIASMRGEQQRARAAAEEGIQIGKEKFSPFVEGVGYIRMGHALLLNPLSSVEEVAAQYRQAITLMDELNVRRGKSEPLAGLCLLCGHVVGDWAMAERYGQEGLKIAEEARDQWFRAFCLAGLGSTALVLNRPEAGAYLAQAEQAFISAGDQFGLTLTRLAQARLAFNAGDHQAFAAAIEAALAGTQAGGYAFLFKRRTLFGMRDPQTLIPLLTEAIRRGIRAEYAAWLLAEMGISHPENHPGFTLRIRTLGNFQVWRGDSEVTGREWQREKARQLLQLFVTYRGRQLHKEQIEELLWPEADAETATRDFKVALNALFNALEPGRAARSGSFYVSRRGTAYGLDLTSGLWLDADAFEDLAKRGFAASEQGDRAQAAELLRQALDLYQGDFLQDVPYEDWCTEERERLQVLFLRGAEWLAQAALRDGEYEACIRLCDRILARDHCWEEAFRLMMLSYSRMGNRSMALRTYDRCVHNLQSEMGIAPMPTTVQLYDRIRKSEDPGPVGPRGASVTRV